MTDSHVPDFARCMNTFEAELDFIHRCLRRYGVQGADAEDLAQDVFFVMWRRWSAFDASRPLRPWLSGIAYKVTRRHQRKIGRFVPQPTVDKPDDAPTAEDAIDSARAGVRVRKALSTLSEKHRSVLVLHDMEGLPMREIASRMEVPLFTAYSRLRLAREALAKEMDRRQRRSFTAPALLFDFDSPSPRLAAETRERVLARIRAAGPRHRDAGPAFGRPRLGRTAWVTAGLGLVGVMGLWLDVVSSKESRQPAPVVSARAERTDVPAAETRSERVRALPRATTAAPTPALRVPDMDEGLARGLTAYWRFDDDRAAHWAHDSSGRGHDCILRGAIPSSAWGDGTVGGAMRFGRLQWLECIDGEPAATAPKEISGVAWIERTRARNERHWALVARRMASTPFRYFFFGFAGDDLMIDSNAWHGKIVRPFPRALGEWVHVAFTHDGEGVTKLFIAGNEVGRAQHLATAVSGESALLTIGAFSMPEAGAARAFFDGSIDELALYDRALGAEEIAALAAGVQPRLRANADESRISVSDGDLSR